MLEAIAFAVSVPFLLLIFGLATISFRGGERAGYHEIVASPPAGTLAVQRRTQIGIVNRLLVAGLGLTLLAATVVMLDASFVLDSWAWP